VANFCWYAKRSQNSERISLMYSWLWRKLLGNKYSKVAQVVVLTAGALAAMYFFLFPWLDVVIFPELETEI
jgi:hypothetical protein